MQTLTTNIKYTLKTPTPHNIRTNTQHELHTTTTHPHTYISALLQIHLPYIYATAMYYCIHNSTIKQLQTITEYINYT